MLRTAQSKNHIHSSILRHNLHWNKNYSVTTTTMVAKEKCFYSTLYYISNQVFI